IARHAFDESLRLRRELEDAAGESWAQQWIAYELVEQADLEGATQHAQAALGIARRQKLAGPAAAALITLADVARERGDAAEAQKRLEEALTMASKGRGGGHWKATAKLAQAQLAFDNGDKLQAGGLARAALDIFARIGASR